MLTYFPKELVNIIYRYIFKHKIGKVNMQYYKKVDKFWNENESFFGSGFYWANYRGNMYCNRIYKFGSNKVVGHIPSNYF